MRKMKEIDFWEHELDKEELYFVHDAVLNRKYEHEQELIRLRESDSINETIEIELTCVIAQGNEILSKISKMISDYDLLSTSNVTQLEDDPF